MTDEKNTLNTGLPIPRSAFPLPSSNTFDLKQRTFDFSLRTMRLAESLPESRSGRTIANQLVRSGTSVGANYRAAKRAKSTKDFIAKMGIVEEECDETIFWIELAIASQCVTKAKVEALLKEANEILAITVASIKTAKQTWNGERGTRNVGNMNSEYEKGKNHDR